MMDNDTHKFTIFDGVWKGVCGFDTVNEDFDLAKAAHSKTIT
jgi:hypothetical protein